MTPEHAVRPIDRPAPSMRDVRAIVTGAASGIGFATAQLLAARGASVVGIDVAATELPGGILCLSADLRDGAAVSAAVERACDLMGGLDSLVSNAGIGAVGTITDNPDDQWHDVLDVNVIALVRLMRSAMPALMTSKWPSVVTTCSVVAECGFPQRALYSASKGALMALTRALAADLLPHGIRVNCVSPGTTDTPWVASLVKSADEPAAELAKLARRQPSGRLVSPDEVAQAIAFLVDPLSGSITGEVLHVDSGLTALRLPVGAL